MGVSNCDFDADAVLFAMKTSDQTPSLQNVSVYVYAVQLLKGRQEINSESFGVSSYSLLISDKIEVECALFFRCIIAHCTLARVYC